MYYKIIETFFSMNDWYSIVIISSPFIAALSRYIIHIHIQRCYVYIKVQKKNRYFILGQWKGMMILKSFHEKKESKEKKNPKGIINEAIVFSIVPSSWELNVYWSTSRMSNDYEEEKKMIIAQNMSGEFDFLTSEGLLQ